MTPVKQNGDAHPDEENNVTVDEFEPCESIPEADVEEAVIQNGQSNETIAIEDIIVPELEISTTPDEVRVEEITETEETEKADNNEDIKADSEEDVPLSHLKNNKQNSPEPVKDSLSPNPYAHIRGRQSLRSASPFRIHSEPTSPSGFGFPLLRKADGKQCLVQGTVGKRQRHEVPSDSPTAKKVCRGWTSSLTGWWKREEEQPSTQPPSSAAETLASPSTNRCVLM